MLIIDDSASTELRDDRDPALRWQLPTGLQPGTSAEARPDVLLVAGSDGGLLRLSLVPHYPGPGRPVPLEGGRFRLVAQLPAATEQSAWWDAHATQDAVVERNVALSPLELALARRVLDLGGPSVEVEVEIEVAGVGRTFPWLARFGVADIGRRLAAILGPGPVADWAQVEAAFLALDPGDFVWTPLSPSALPLSKDVALRALAARARDQLLERGEGGWTPIGDGAARGACSFAIPRRRTRTVRLRWSLSQFWAGLDAAQRVLHFVSAEAPAPFQAADVQVVNGMPLAADGIQAIAVELSSSGPIGRRTHTFAPGTAESAPLRFARQANEPLAVSWRARATVMAAAGPVVVETAPAEVVGMMVELRPETVGLWSLEVSASDAVFDHASAVEVTMGRATLVLTRAVPLRRTVGRAPPVRAPVVVVAPDGRRVSLGEVTVGPRGLRINEADLGVGLTETVQVRLAAAHAARVAYLAVQREGDGWRTLDPEASLRWTVVRPSLVAEVSGRYRTRYVQRADGRAQPFQTSEWRTFAGTEVEVAVP